VITGSFADFSRQELETKLKGLGAEVSGSVSKKTDYLLAGDRPGKKFEKAKELGTQVVFENDLENLFGKLKN
jgi:DNA ligase (NAD+)